MSGSFITFEGGEGSGKSTQLKLLSDAFAATGKPCIVTREPGGTESAERIRELLVTGHKDAWNPLSETLLFYAARTEHVERLVKPALIQGKTVLCDRFADSTRVYQGTGKKVPADFIDQLHKISLGNFAPNLTIILDIDPAIGLARAATRKHAENRFESMQHDFHTQVRAGFIAIARNEPKRCVVLDAAQLPDVLHKQIVDVIGQRLAITL